MTSQRRHQEPAGIALQDNCIYLARDGMMRSYAKTADFFRDASKNPALMDGCMLALHQVSGPEDVHYPAWEMHPEGDELLILASGSLSVEFRDEEEEPTAPLLPQTGFIVPAGTWHRLIVHEPAVLIAITPRHNTVHEMGIIAKTS